MMVNLSALSIVFCLFLGSINSYFVTALQRDTSVYSCKSTFDATGGEANVLPDVCLVAVLALFPFLQIASIISVSSFNETAHVWLLLRCVLRARPQLKKTGWVPGIWQAFVGEALFVRDRDGLPHAHLLPRRPMLRSAPRSTFTLSPRLAWSAGSSSSSTRGRSSWWRPTGSGMARWRSREPCVPPAARGRPPSQPPRWSTSARTPTWLARGS
mmetsp:Transcript_12884/g.38533  ORF Transcript_12884/g.38533 Transcript_12884/m.38533 type:complete len:213 (+) Transcript_12884:374-1012(+)